MVGIVDGGAVVEDGSVILSLPLLQGITGNQGKVNIIDLRVTPGTGKAEMARLCEQITGQKLNDLYPAAYPQKETGAAGATAKTRSDVVHSEKQDAGTKAN